MKNRIFVVFILVISAIMMFCGVGDADLLSVIPKMAAVEDDSYSISLRFADARKLIEDLYPYKLFEALEPLSSDLGLDSLVNMNNIVKALTKSNIREFASLIVMNSYSELRDGGVIISVPDSKSALDEVSISGELTLYNLVIMIGGVQLLEAIKAADDSFEDYVFMRDRNGVFYYKNNYICIDGDRIISFETKEATLSVADAVRAGVDTKTTDFESPNILLIHIPKVIAETAENIKAEIGFLYENSTWKIKTKSNVFRLMSGIGVIESETLERPQIALNTIPIVGRGKPFFSAGGNTFIDGADSIEERLMNLGDMVLTLNWATFLQIAQQYGISKKDIGNLFASSVAVVFGLDSKFFEIPMPLGGYIAFTGKNNAASKIIGAISKSTAETGVMTESEIFGWDKVFSISIDPLVPNALIAQSGETLLIGVLNPEDLIIKLDINEIGLPDEKIISWINFSPEKVWKAVRKAYIPLSVLLFSGAFGDVSNSEKEAVRFAQKLLNTDLPIKWFNICVPSLEEVDINIAINPNPLGDFWKVLFMWLVKVM